MELTPEEEKIIRFLREKAMNFGKLALVITYHNGKIKNVGLTERYETLYLTGEKK